jgi:hypothetical protein
MAINWASWDTCVATYDWLAAEQKHTFGPQFTGPQSSKNPAFARNRVEQITKEQLPNTWKRFQYYRGIRNIETDTAAKARLRLQVGKMLLDSCRLTQDACVWLEVSDGMDAERSMRNSFRSIRGYIDGLKSGRTRLPERTYLANTLPKAVDTFNGVADSYNKVHPAFTTIVGLAIQGLIEQSPTGPLLPEPGRIGEPVEWQLPNKAS